LFIVSSGIDLLIHCLFSAVLMLASQVFFKGQMELLTSFLFLTGVRELKVRHNIISG